MRLNENYDVFFQLFYLNITEYVFSIDWHARTIKTLACWSADLHQDRHSSEQL
jgi:hypothetical protein